MSNSIILVDDDSVTRQLLIDILEVSNLEVIPFTSGKECIENAPQLPPSVIVTDLFLTDMYGLDLLATLHNHYAQKITALIISAQRVEECPSDILEKLGAVFMEKPFELTAFVNKVKLLKDLRTTM